jgi:urease accessory protein
MTATARIVAVADEDGVTRLPVLSSRVPLVLRRTPDAVYLVGGAAGPLGGDDLTLTIEVGDGAALKIRTAAASVALPGTTGARADADAGAWAGAESVFRVHATVGAGARFEYLPEPVIVADGARHRVELRVTLAADATLLAREEIILGRHGERGGECVTRMRVDVDGVPLLRQEVTVSGTDEVSLGPAVLAGHRAFGSLLVIDNDRPLTGMVGDGVAVMPLAGPGAIVTAVAPDARALRYALTRIVDGYPTGSGGFRPR